MTEYIVGDAVGEGYLVDTCGSCHACHDDQGQFCDERIHGTNGGIDRIDGTLNRGGYSESIVINEGFVLSIPAQLDPAAATQILCAGITT